MTKRYLRTNKSRKNRKSRKSKKSKKSINKSKSRNKGINKKNNRITMGGALIYNLNGSFRKDPTLLHNGKNFFRKMTNNENEIELCKILMKNPHKNIITIYDIGKDYVDMELLNTNIEDVDVSEIQDIMTDVKTYLQNLGIIYIDWKIDNIGISNEDGEIKLFDFDVSGFIDIETKKWIIKPPKLYSYNKAVQNGMVTPIDIDDYAFTIGITEKM